MMAALAGKPAQEGRDADSVPTALLWWPQNYVSGQCKRPSARGRPDQGLLSVARLSSRHRQTSSSRPVAGELPNARISSYINWMNPARFSSRSHSAFFLPSTPARPLRCQSQPANSSFILQRGSPPPPPPHSAKRPPIRCPGFSGGRPTYPQRMLNHHPFPAGFAPIQ
ncbi:hypothetical protein IF1G_00367 [Cordyceps javanica]|uniref:Uncharacterized protein n=1 Tax=Cordyceps javanica TaxID=43265 RepID=A0A545VFE8_9HYPO|nr:hypothetical protein IF1G_00367 [Cordyceps javanica]